MKKELMLVIHQGALGDFILILPFLELLKKAYEIDIFCKDQNRKVASFFSIANKTFPIESSIFSSIFLSKPDKLLRDILRSYKNILIFSFSRQILESLSSIVDKECKLFLVSPRPNPKLRIHVAEFIKEELIKLGLIKENEVAYPKLRKRKETQITIIHPGAGSVRKRWDISKFLELFHLLESNGIKCKFLIGPSEMDLKDILPKDKLIITQDIRKVIEILSLAEGFIGNDSGLSHLSAFMGVPTLVIFGPSDPIRWRPIGEKVEVIRGVDCEPCFEIKDKNCLDPMCFNAIRVRDVFEKYLNLISSGHP